MSSSLCTIAQHAVFLRVPIEIRLRVFDHLFLNQQINVEHEYPDRTGDNIAWQMKRIELSAQLIRTCRQLYEEGHSILYAGNIFNCAQREGLKLLLNTIGLKNFSNVKHIVIDWDQLQDFAWSLAKEDYNEATKGLEVVELATWRIRFRDRSSFLWKQNRSSERQLCESASEICQKHDRLRVVAQKPSPKMGQGGKGSNSIRVKWRFLTSTHPLLANETVLSLDEELVSLRLGLEHERDQQELMAIDAF